VLNAGAVALAIKLGLALEGTVQLRSSFDRKHYHYADLPHGYQITQQREPIVRGGSVRCVGVERARDGARDGARGRRAWLTVGVERVQLEMDTGKSQSVGAEAEAAKGTLVDLNRAGQALVEIVCAPDMRSGEDAAACVEALQRMLRYLHVSDANMEEGSLRCDVNVSVRTAEERARGVFGERVEIKNLNSLRSIARAVKYEAKRHVDVLTAGGRVERETRAFDTNTGKTTVLRTKESLLDYRFMPEPDLPPLVLNPADVEAIASRMPELPSAAFERLIQSGAPASAVSTIIAFPSTLKYYDTAIEHCGAAKASEVANFIANEIIGAARKDAGASHKEPLSSLPHAASARRVGSLLSQVANGDLNGRMAKQVLEALMNGDERALADIVDDVCGGGQISSDDQLQDICHAVVNDMPKEVELFRGGKSKLMGALVGEVMKRTSGRANPKDASKMLADIIADVS
jgi:aspartyl-tRNA(Asn)/glutamyl-tRNA(Gln) amidotransferase subunit B